MQTAVVGELVNIADIRYGGGYGRLALSVHALSPSGEKIPLTQGDVLLIAEKGDYTIVYTVTDYHDLNKLADYKIAADYSDKPVFYEPVGLPKSFLNHNKFYLPELRACF